MFYANILKRTFDTTFTLCLSHTCSAYVVQTNREDTRFCYAKDEKLESLHMQKVCLRQLFFIICD